MATMRVQDTQSESDGHAPRLPDPPSYPFLVLMRDHGYLIALVAGLGAFLAVARKGSVGAGVGAIVVGGSVTGSLAYVHEMTVVVTETLLPEK
jgi:hypothetical protein